MISADVATVFLKKKVWGPLVKRFLGIWLFFELAEHNAETHRNVKRALSPQTLHGLHTKLALSTLKIT